MALTLQTLKNSLSRGEFEPIYLIQGTDLYLMEQVRATFTNMIAPEDRSMNLATFDMREQPLGDAIDDSRAIPFFGDRRVVIIDNAYFLTGETGGKIEHYVEDLQAYMAHPEPQTILVIFAPFEKLDGRKKITKQLKELPGYLSFGKIEEKEIRQMINERLAEQGYQMTATAGNRLLALTNLNLTQIMAELDKLMLYSVDTKVIEEAAVDALVSRTLTQDVFELINLLLHRKITPAVMLYHQLIVNGEEPLRLQGAILGQFRLLVQAKGSKLSEKGLAMALSVHPYRVKLARQTVRSFSYKDLAKAFLGLVNMEKQLKSTRRDPELLFELFILRYQNQS